MMKKYLLVLGAILFTACAPSELEITKQNCDMQKFRYCETTAKILLEDKKDEKSAIQYYEKSCQKGYGCLELADIYIKNNNLEKALNSKINHCNFGGLKSCKEIAFSFEETKDYKKAFEYYEKSCNLNDFASCIKASELASKDKAYEFYLKACDINIDDCVNEASKLDDLTNIKLLKLACAKNDKYCKLKNQKIFSTFCKTADECGKLGDNFLNSNELIDKDYSSAALAYSMSCDLGNAVSCNELGLLYENGNGVEQSRIKANEYYKVACNGKEKYGCYNLALAYENGRGLDVNIKEALRLYTKSCDLGFATACYNAANIYNHGYLGVKKDYKKAKINLEKACTQNEFIGCNNLGNMYANGQGVKKDNQKAVILYAKSCDNHNEIGCYNLALHYSNGLGVNINYPKAKELYEYSCDKKYASACNNLGVLYAKGQGTRYDIEKAKYYYGLACDYGSQMGCDNYKSYMW